MTEVLRVTVGGSDARTVQEKLSRDVGATQVTIDVSYLAITDVDARLHSGELSDLIPSSATPTSYVPGHVVCGVVKQVGGAVETLKVEERVVGMIPLGREGGARERLRADALQFVAVPESLNATNAVAVFDAGLRAFTALHYECHSLRGEILLVMDAAAGCNGEVAMQLGVHRELRVLACVRSREDATVLEARFQHRVEVLVVGNVGAELAQSVMARTAGLGVDYVYESLALVLTPEERKARIACLGAHGKWCLQRQQQLDPPETRALLLRGASVCFVFSPVWSMHPMQRGRYLQVATEVMRLASEGKLSVSNVDRFPFAKTVNAIEAAGKRDGCDGAVVVVIKK